jgi:hypothetical protein
MLLDIELIFPDLKQQMPRYIPPPILNTLITQLKSENFLLKEIIYCIKEIS